MMNLKFQGVVYPALHNIISHWAPKEEKGKFTSALLGGILGNMITWAVLGYVIEKWGWSFGFHIPAVCTLVFVALWYYNVTDFPADHPRISKKEMELIENSIGDTSKDSRDLPPMLSMITSLPLMALLVLHYGNVWGLYFLQTGAPKFLTEALKFNLSSAGFLSAMPLLGRLLAGFGFGILGDFIKSKSCMKTTTIRKSFCLICEWLSFIAENLLLIF